MRRGGCRKFDWIRSPRWIDRPRGCAYPPPMPSKKGEQAGRAVPSAPTSVSLAPSEGERAGVRGHRATLREIDRFFNAGHAVIIPLTDHEILDEQIARKPA